jgi:biopolymer transport protein ExbB
MLTLLAATASASASAQGDGTAHSFAEAFFISHAVDVNGVRNVEWLGSLVIWLLMATSVASIGLIGQLAAANRRTSIAPEVVMHRAAEYVDAGRYRETMAMLSEPDADSDFSTILLGGLERAPAGFQSMEGGLEQAATEVVARRTRHVEILNVIGQVSPMVGLFGTVYGMILAFQSIVASGGNADPVLLAGGIGTALVTTFWGLVVAIPALAGYAALRGRLDASLTEAISEAETILEKFRPGDAASDARLRSASESPEP